MRRVTGFILSALIAAAGGGTAIAADPPANAPVQEAPTAAALVVQADAAMAKGEVDNALMLGQAAIVVEPTNPVPYVALGNLYVKANQARYARGFYDKALELDPQDSAALAAISRLAPQDQATLSANGG